MNALILGGGGFIGVTYYLNHRDSYDKIYIVDWYKPPTHKDTYLKQTLLSSLRDSDEIIESDVYDIDNYRHVFKDVSVVIMLNADTGTGSSYFKPYDSTLFNASACSFIVQNMISEVNDLSKVQLVFSSSRAVYGEGNWHCPLHGRQKIDRNLYLNQDYGLKGELSGEPLELRSFEEDQPLNPLSIYGLNKAFTENALDLLFKDRPTKIVMLRFQNVYGKGQSRHNPYTGVLNWFSEKLIENEPIEIYENGLIERDFIHVKDAASAIHQSIFNIPGTDNWVFNVGSGAPIKLLKVAEILKEAFHSKSEIRVTNKFRAGDVLGAYSDNAKIKSAIGYEPEVSIEEGLNDYVSWYQEN